MLCDECRTNNATIHFVTIVNGNKQERNLCPECAKKLGTDSFMPFSLGDVFPTAFSSFRPQAQTCSACGTSLYDISRTGLLGCPSCYDQLRDGIMPIISRVQNRVRHTGRSPVGFESKKLNTPADDSPAAQLKKQLEQAVANEEYEKAAELRDQIRALETNGNDSKEA